MLFSSITFLFIFLPVVVIVYYLLPKKIHNNFLLLASIVFYAFGEPKYLPIMFFVILINYLGALLISASERYAKFWLIVTVILNLSVLFYFKYFNFLIENINLIFKSQVPILNIALPLGISFYTFQALSYSIDVYRKLVIPQKNFYKLALYISLFPQLIAGPIIKYHDIVNQIDNREETFEQFYYGLRRFIVGLAKKVLIANTLGAVAENIFSAPISEVGTILLWIVAILWALQVYYDFSAYSDMALGLGAMFGFKFKENFNYPYVSRTISEYWRRWHISLGTWCKDYIYIPMGGSRVSTLRIYFNLFFLFFIIGLWHGATWNFVFFGLWHATLVIIERILNLNKRTFNFLGEVILHIYTTIAIIIGSIFGCAKTLEQTYNCLKYMFFCFRPNDSAFYMFYYFDRYELAIFVIAIICCIPFFKNIYFWNNLFVRILVDLWLIVLLILSIAQIATSSFNPFIYFRF